MLLELITNLSDPSLDIMVIHNWLGGGAFTHCLKERSFYRICCACVAILKRGGILTLGHIKKKLVIVLLISQIRGGEVCNKACVRTRTMQTSIVQLAYLNKEEMVNLDLGVKLDDLLHDLVILQA
jgi:hypothetical protein